MNRQKAPKYVQIRNLLAQLFTDRDYRPGQKLPTEFEIMNEFHVSRTTVRQALSLLAEEGILEKRHGSGTYYRGSRQVNSAQAPGKGLIGLVNFFSMDYIYGDIIRGIQETVEASGYNLVLANCDRDMERELSNIRSLISQGIQGVIIEPSQTAEMTNGHPLIEEVRRAGIPIVATHWGFSYDQISTVTIDDEQAACSAVHFLLGRGLERIAIIHVDDVQVGRLRLRGYQQALQEAGIREYPEYRVGYSVKEELDIPDLGYLLTRRLFQRCRGEGLPLPEAIFYFNDRLAGQGYGAIREEGLRIPEEISVLGFDDHRGSAFLKPPLTSMVHPKSEMGKWAARLLIDEIEGPGRIPKKLVFEAPIMDRSSVRPSPGAGTRRKH